MEARIRSRELAFCFTAVAHWDDPLSGYPRCTCLDVYPMTFERRVAAHHQEHRAVGDFVSDPLLELLSWREREDVRREKN
jgi:hypothetical protein